MQLGFIGTGNMGGALARAAVRALGSECVTLADRDTAKAEALAAKLGCGTATAEELAGSAQLVFLGVKPQVMPAVLAQLAPILAQRQDPFCLVSMAAGVAIADIRRMAGSDYPMIRIMPNTPVSVGRGVVLFDPTDNVPKELLTLFLNSMSKAGLVDPLPEHLMDAGSAVSGCGPAFAAMFLEALADGGVACGLPRDKAMAYAAQMLLGTATLIQKTGQHPGQVKDAVCSPGGSTIAGVRALEEGAFRGTVFQAVDAAYQRTKELGK